MNTYTMDEFDLMMEGLDRQAVEQEALDYELMSGWDEEAAERRRVCPAPPPTFDEDESFGICERCGACRGLYRLTACLPWVCSGCYEALGYLDLDFDDMSNPKFTDYALPVVKAMPEVRLRNDEQQLIEIGQYLLRYYLQVLRRRPELWELASIR